MKDLKSLISFVIFKYTVVSGHWIGGKKTLFWNRNNVFFTFRLKKQILFMTSSTFQSSVLHLWYIKTSLVPSFTNTSEALMESLVLSVLCPLSGCGISSFSFFFLNFNKCLFEPNCGHCQEARSQRLPFLFLN